MAQPAEKFDVSFAMWVSIIVALVSVTGALVCARYIDGIDLSLVTILSPVLIPAALFAVLLVVRWAVRTSTEAVVEEMDR